MALRGIGGLAIQTVKAIGAFASRALTADVPDSTATGGNARGTNAVDLQTIRGAATNVASGVNSGVLSGNSNTASATGAVVAGGTSNTASGNNSFAAGTFITASGGSTFGFGSSSTASQAFAVAIGSATTADGTGAWARGQSAIVRARYGADVFASGQFSTGGDAQMASHVIRGSTTDAATGVRLTTDAAAAGANNSVTLANNSTYAFTGTLVAQVSATSSKSWTINGLIRRGANAAATALVGVATATSTFGDAGLSTIAVAITADATNGAIAFTVNGVAATNIKYVGAIQTVEVVG